MSRSYNKTKHTKYMKKRRNLQYRATMYRFRCVNQYSDEKHSQLMYYTALISYYPLYNNSLPFRYSQSIINHTS